MRGRPKGSNAQTKIERLKKHPQVARYDQAAINKCWQLYLQNNGQNHERIAAEMRREYPSFGRERVAQWADKYRWDEGLKFAVDFYKRQSLNSADKLTTEIEELRERLSLQIKQSGSFDRELVQLHRDYCRLSQEQLTKVQAPRDTFGSFVGFWERLLGWLPDYSPHAAEALLQVAEPILKRAAEEYADSTAEGQEPTPDV